MEAELFKRQMSRDPKAAPIVENANLKPMAEGMPAARPIGGKTLRMAAKPPAPATTGRGPRMEPVPENVKPPPQSARRKDQQPPTPSSGPRPAAEAGAGESYLRIRVRVGDGDLTVQHIAQVEGPLVAHEDLNGPMAYEVTVDGKRVASAAIPDAGVNRAFPPPQPAEGQRGHFFVPSTFHDIQVRVPSDAVSLSSLPTTEIALYRVKEGPLPREVSAQPLAARFPRELREVARLRGIDLEAVPAPAREAARRLLG